MNKHLDNTLPNEDRLNIIDVRKFRNLIVDMVYETDQTHPFHGVDEMYDLHRTLEDHEPQSIRGVYELSMLAREIAAARRYDENTLAGGFPLDRILYNITGYLCHAALFGIPAQSNSSEVT